MEWIEVLLHGEPHRSVRGAWIALSEDVLIELGLLDSTSSVQLGVDMDISAYIARNQVAVV